MRIAYNNGLARVLFNITLLLMLGQVKVYAQDTLLIQDVIQETIEDQPGASEYNTYLEELELLREKPINLNKASHKDLEQLVEFGLLSPQDVHEIIQYRKEVGRFSDVGDLQIILDSATFQRILPFVSVKSNVFVPSEMGKYVRTGRHQIIIRGQRLLEKQAGYLLPETDSQRFLGSPWRLYFRYQFRHSLISWGFTGEKDPGEPFFRYPNKPEWYAPWKGFDFYSAYLEVKPGNIVRRVIIGDYEVRWGQGLVAWTGFAFGKSSYVMTFKRVGYELKPYTSVNETRYLRGVATTVQLGPIRTTLIASSKWLDASTRIVNDSTLDEDSAIIVTYFNEFGYHRNWDEISRKRNFNQKIVGGRVAYEFTSGNVGLHVLHTKYSLPLGKTYTRLYNMYDLRGDQLTNIGLSYEFTFGSWHFFGEGAMSSPGKYALLTGLITALDKHTDIGLVYRYYDPQYRHSIGRPFGEYYRGYNEEALFLAFQIRPIRAVTLSAYLDLYRHPWLRFERDAPTRGYDYIIRAEYKPARRTQLYVLIKDEKREENYWKTRNTLPIGELVPVRYGYVRFHLKHDINKNVSFRARFQTSLYHVEPDEPERGYMIYNEIKYRFNKPPLTLYGRLALFETESWRTRIYVYETDVLYYFSVPPLYGRGFRYYIMASYYVNRHLTVWLRFARTHLLDRESIGSGLNRTQGPNRTEIKLQARIRF